MTKTPESTPPLEPLRPAQILGFLLVLVLATAILVAAGLDEATGRAAPAPGAAPIATLNGSAASP